MAAREKMGLANAVTNWEERDRRVIPAALLEIDILGQSYIRPK